ncbi:MAG: hypothetical protein JRJ03_00015 [Deltaproteobacteria bacterium]|nr:hypothetical protein [Deltaproteobacteria bacterium]MBW2063291.1 hypothetical protein [Deltaproteobacteria bacterium]
MKRLFFFNLFANILVFSLAFSGCGTATSLYRDVRNRSQDDLKKIILVLPVLNQAGFSLEAVQKAETQFKDVLEKEGNVTVLRGSLPASLAGSKGLSGIEMGVDPLVIKEAESMGADILVSTIFHPLETRTRKVGIWPAMWTRRELVISISLSAIDVTNKTILLSNVANKTLKMREPLEEFILFEEGHERESTGNEVENPLSYVDEKALEKALSRMVKAQASITTDRLKDKPWTGRILSVDNDSVMINGGQDAGVLPGHVFDVFGEGETIRTASGNTYRVIGEKIGQIKVISSGDRDALAVPLEGSGFKAGQYVRLKSGQ